MMYDNKTCERVIQSNQQHLTTFVFFVYNQLTFMSDFRPDTYSVKIITYNLKRNIFMLSVLSLIQNIALKTEKKDLIVQKIIRSWSVREIPPQTHLCLDDLQLTVPPIPPSGSRYCNNIDIHYTLQVTIIYHRLFFLSLTLRL